MSSLYFQLFGALSYPVDSLFREPCGQELLRFALLPGILGLFQVLLQERGKFRRCLYLGHYAWKGRCLRTCGLDLARQGRVLFAAPHGGRLHVARNVPVGRVEMLYSATVDGWADVEPVSAFDRLIYLRPSRYCESDRIAALAFAQFDGLSGRDLLEAVSSWVGVNVRYVAGSSRSIDGAVATLLGREGVCRDFAHLAVAFCRCMNIPARYCTGYLGDAGMPPPHSVMDFAAWFEAYVDGHWHTFDPRNNAPRIGRILIAGGAKAIDPLSGAELSDVAADALDTGTVGGIDSLKRSEAKGKEGVNILFATRVDLRFLAELPSRYCELRIRCHTSLLQRNSQRLSIFA